MSKKRRAKINGVLSKKGNTYWCQTFGLPCYKIQLTMPLVIDAKNLMHILFGTVQHAYATRIKHRIQQEDNLDLREFAKVAKTMLSNARKGDRLVFVCLEGWERSAYRSNKGESNGRQKERARYVGGRSHILASNRKNTPIIPRPIIRILVSVALQTGCNVLIPRSEADDVVAEIANSLNRGVAVSNDGDVFNLSVNLMMVDSFIGAYAPSWITRYPRRGEMRYGCYMERIDVLQAMWDWTRHIADSAQKRRIIKQLEDNHRSLPPSRPLDDIISDCQVIQTLGDYDRCYSAMRMSRMVENIRQAPPGVAIAAPCGIQWDPPSADMHDAHHPSVATITQILRWGKIQSVVSSLACGACSIYEISRRRLGDTRRQVTVIDPEMCFTQSICEAIMQEDPDIFLTKILPGIAPKSQDVYTIARTLARLWFYTDTLAAAALQHEFVHELINAFPSCYAHREDDTSPHLGYDSLVDGSLTPRDLTRFPEDCSSMKRTRLSESQTV